MSDSEVIDGGLPNQYHRMPDAGFDSDRLASPLARGNRRPVSGASPLVVEEHILGHLILRGPPDVLKAAVLECIGLPLPSAPLTSSSNDQSCIRWLGPDEWLVTLALTGLAQAERDLRGACGAQIALVDVSGGQTILVICGDCATQVLMKSTSYDVAPENFPPGKVVTTTFAQAQVVLRRVNDNTFELVLRRSFSDYLWAWLRDAASEFGFAVQGEA
ncbi:MAG: sarcosine oxidase subunit gamma [Pseudomonadales bacterium]|jgi:sarcosine oxidase subunit gamma|tara:strand:- start:2029 stop:2679 length:651 start_codon:yes stop_codon:yes gene_type:complete